MENQKSIQGFMQEALDSVRAVMDGDTVTGKEIVAKDGTIIVPISRLSMGIATGGLDLPDKSEKKNFGGGAGTGVTLTPIAFLVAHPDGKTEVVPMVMPEESPFDKAVSLFNNAPDYIGKLTALINGKKKDPEAEDKAAEEATAKAAAYAEENK